MSFRIFVPNEALQHGMIMTRKDGETEKRRIGDEALRFLRSTPLLRVTRCCGQCSVETWYDTQRRRTQPMGRRNWDQQGHTITPLMLVPVGEEIMLPRAVGKSRTKSFSGWSVKMRHAVTSAAAERFRERSPWFP